MVSSELIDICHSFKTNIDSLTSASLLPLSIAYNTANKTDWIERFRRAMAQGSLKGTKEEQKIEIENRMEKLDHNDSFNWSLDVLDDLIEDTDTGIKRGIESLLNFSTVNIWTIFEVLSGDIWIVLVNARPKTLAKVAVEYKKENLMKSITNMMIESSFELSLKNRIGEIASSEYDFSSLNGIIKAFTIILQKDKLTIKSLLSQPELKKVQAIRNMVVHNGGLIDEAFCGMIDDESKLGQNIEITGAELTGYANTIFRICTDLILFIDNVIQQNTESKNT